MSKEDDSDKKKKEKKLFELDITNFDEMQEIIHEYFYLCSSLLGRNDLDVKKIWLNIDSNKLKIETEPCAEDSEEDTEWDMEWV